ncbi:MAG: Fic family protein [Spirochaetaceae bacterium]|jgi:Fic family protein|nr:Fic family protein [Spirochaetaceae bacterium]
MRVISGSMGKEKVHFQAPPAKNLPKELESFFYWFNNPKENANWLLRSAIAHLWFVTLHPFEDGNGRIARTLSEMFLVRSDHSTNRYYSMSGQIYKRRREYYQILEKTQKGDLDCTAWMIWYLDCLEKSLDVSLEEVEKSCKRKIIWDYVNQQHINPRQKKILGLLTADFKGKLTSSKWAKLCKCSQDTAGRDIKDLVEKKILSKGSAGGRSTHYILQKQSL